MQIIDGKLPAKVEKGTKIDLIDRAARGDVEAAGLLAEGYLYGKYQCEKNAAKAKKWAAYAAKRGDALGGKILKELGV